MNDFVKIHGMSNGFKEVDLYTIRRDIASVIEGVEYVDIVNPIQRSGRLDYDAFGDTCLGTHTITIRFNDKKKYTSNGFSELTGGGMGTAFVFLLAVPGKELKQAPTDSSRAEFIEEKKTRTRTAKKGSGRKQSTLKRNRRR